MENPLERRVERRKTLNRYSNSLLLLTQFNFNFDLNRAKAEIQLTVLDVWDQQASDMWTKKGLTRARN